MPSIVDFHNHYYPPAYLAALAQGPSAVQVTVDGDGNPRLHYPGDYNIAPPGQRDLTARERALEEHGIEHQVLSLTTPGTHVEEPATAVRLARLVNDAFAEAVAARPRRFSALATLPLNDPAAAAQELARALTELRLPGAMLFSNVNKVPLNDRRFWPLYEIADDAQAVLMIHPTYPVGVEAMQEYWLMPLVGFLLDTTLAAARLVFSGVPERFPRIRWVLGHLGGAIPYMAERLDRGFRAFPECRTQISRPPSEYLRRLYYDTVNFDRRALELAVRFAGAEHILAGSDYAHQIGSLALMRQSLEALDISDAEREAIMGGNARRLLNRS